MVRGCTKKRRSGGKPLRKSRVAPGIPADMAIRIQPAKGALYILSVMLDNPRVYGLSFSATMISNAGRTKISAAHTALWVDQDSFH